MPSALISVGLPLGTEVPGELVIKIYKREVRGCLYSCCIVSTTFWTITFVGCSIWLVMKIIVMMIMRLM